MHRSGAPLPPKQLEPDRLKRIGPNVTSPTEPEIDFVADDNMFGPGLAQDTGTPGGAIGGKPITSVALEPAACCNGRTADNAEYGNAPEFVHAEMARPAARATAKR